jgi:ABC-type multidrug transport system fused ATPase/permease subunit
MKHQVWSYTSKKILVKVLSLSLAQQIFVALSTWSLIEAGFHLETPREFLTCLVLAFLFQVLAPGLQIFIKALEFDLIFEAYRRFLEKNLLGHAGTPGLWRRKDVKDRFLTSVGIDAEGYLGAMIFVGLDIFTFVVSLILGTLVLGAMIDAAFVTAYILSGILSYALYVALSPHVKARYEQEQAARTSFNAFLLTSWDNLFFKNQRLVQKYKTRMGAEYQAARQNTIDAGVASEFSVFALGLVSATPVMAVVLWIASHHLGPGQTALLIGLLATIPRQLNMLTTFRSLFQNMTSFIGFEAKFRVIHQNAELTASPYLSQIQLPKITLAQSEFKTLPEVTAFLKSAAPGRYEINGENGSGKSSLLLHLNEVLENSFYLPAHPDLAISDHETPGSSGEKMLQHIHFLSEGNESYLLLDEWDANLDAANRNLVASELERLSKTKVLIEVRHPTKF